jgi:lipopolysaccharide biosynthesis protein
VSDGGRNVSVVQSMEDGLKYFDYDLYTTLYPDLSSLSEHEAIQHWENYGHKEGRVCYQYKYTRNYLVSSQSFDYQYYRTRYSDVRHYSQEEALAHWNRYGKKENRVCRSTRPASFNPIFYLENNRDLKNGTMRTPEQLEDHWNVLGMKQGRAAFKQPVPVNLTTNIVIVIHLYHIELYSEMVEYIENVQSVFLNTTVMFTIPKSSNFNIKINVRYPDAIVIKVENKGTDNYPFLKCVKYMRQKNIPCDFVLKLHTKISTNPVEGLDRWRQQLIHPITNHMNLLVLQHYFKTVENIGYVSAASCVFPKRYDNDFQQNIDGVNELIRKFPHLEKDWLDFNAGNMFWISNEVLNTYLTSDLIDYATEEFLTDMKPPSNLDDKGVYIEYICERLFTGVFCYKRKNIHVTNDAMSSSGISFTNGILDHKNFYCPNIFNICDPQSLPIR